MILECYGITLSSSSPCVCPGDVLTYECTVEGIADVMSTIWTGTAFDCQSSENELLLIHSTSRFTETQRCNHGAITGRGIRVVGNNYTSQINITVDPSMDGENVVCFYHSGSSITVVGNSSIQLTTGIVTQTFNGYILQLIYISYLVPKMKFKHYVLNIYCRYFSISNWSFC